MGVFIKKLIYLNILLLGICFASGVEAATQIYRSVGPGAVDPLATGTGNNLTISGSTATFAAAPGDPIGVGDAIQYDSDGNNSIDAIAFIHGRTSATVYSVANAAGGVPTAVTNDQNWSIYRAYASLAWAETGDENNSLDDAVENFESWSSGKDLTISDEQWNIACYAGQGGVADQSAFTIGGWTTDEDNYMKIYTPFLLSEVGVSQRHAGKWDDTKYRLSVSTNNASMIVYLKNFYLDGLQISSSYVGNLFGLSLYGVNIDNQLNANISNCIIRADSTDTEGIRINPNVSLVNIYNSVIYKTVACGLGDEGVVISFNNAINIYNSTIYGFDDGIEQDDGTVTVKNSAVFGNGDDFDGTMTIDHCASDDGDGTNPVIPSDWSNVFVDRANYDFHLKSTDTNLKDAGASNPGSGLFSTDIDGQARPIGGGWDIGADEEGRKTVFYSVGQDGTTDRKTGSPTVTISGGVATFSVAQTGNIGGGDRITYNTSNIVYISGKISETQWEVVTNTGLAPPDISNSTVVSIKREYTSLSGAEAGATDSNHLGTSDLAANNYQLNFPCYYDTGADATSLTIDGWTTDSDNYLRIYAPAGTSEANVNQRHSGLWNDSKYHLQISTFNARIITNSVSYTRFEGLQLHHTGGGGSAGGIYSLLYSGLLIKDSIFRKSSTEVGTAVNIRGGSSVKSVVVNSVAYGGWDVGFYLNGSTSAPNSVVGYNLTSYDNTYGYDGYYSQVYKNCIGANNTTADFYRDVTYSLTMNNCASSDGTADDFTGSNNRVNQTFTFVDAAGGDFHLSVSDTGAQNHGMDLSGDSDYSFFTDIDGEERGDGWCIGADDFPTVARIGTEDSSAPPVAWYKFDEGYGDTAHNEGSAGSSANGTLQSGGSGGNATNTAMWDKGGRFGSAMEFDGGNDYVSTSTDYDFVPGNDISVSLWFKADSLPASGNDYVMISKSDGSNRDVSLQIENYSGMAAHLRSWVAGNNGNSIVGNTALAVDTWYHFVMTFNNSTNTATLYLNGDQDAQRIDQTADFGPGNPATNIGRWIEGASAYFDGKVDEVKIYNYALSADQVAREYNQGGAMVFGSQGTDSSGQGSNADSREYCVPGDTSTCNPPVGEWNFEQRVSGNGQTLFDTSGNGNNGTTSSANGTGMDCTQNGKVGFGCQFDGSDDYVSISDSSVLAVNRYSISAWVKVDLSLSNTRRIFERRCNGHEDCGWYANYILGIYDNGTVDFGHYGAAFNFIQGTTDLRGRGWTHIEGVYDGSNIMLYVNGRQENMAAAVDPRTTGTQHVNISYDAADSSGWFPGQIDQVRIFNYARTPAQIAWEYNKGKPVAWWRMDENVSGNGQTIHDESASPAGGNNHGTTDDGVNNTGMDCTVDGKFGKACSFDGVDDYVSIADPASGILDFGVGDFSATAWIKADDNGADRIISKWTSVESNGWLLNINETIGGSAAPGFIRFRMNDALANNFDFAIDGNVDDASWHHIVVSVDRDSITGINLFLDGKQLGTSQDPTAVSESINNDQPFAIGNIPIVSGNYMNGQVDDVRLYNYALTAEQVKQVMNEGVGMRF